MTYLRKLAIQCEDDYCRKRAVVELISTRNAAMGRFCSEHGKQRESDLRQKEQQDVTRR